MIRVQNEDLNIEKIALSGQCFRLHKTSDETWLNIAGNRVLKITERPDGSVDFHCGKREFKAFWASYFDLETDYADYRRRIPKKDQYMRCAAEFGKGIRILNQDPWETLITFILSQRKNIPAIKACVETLCERYGEPLKDGLYAFPMAQKLAEAGEKELRECSLGYRAPYIMDAARKVSSGELDLDGIKSLPDDLLLEKLMSVKGVGIKVANCTALFAYHRISAFPIDVWIQRVLDEQYGGGEEFPYKSYKGFSGIMQQYLFFYARKSK